MPPWMPMMGATTARSPRESARKKQTNPPTSRMPASMANASGRRSPRPGTPSSASATGSVQMPLPSRIRNEVTYGSTVRLSGTSQ